MKAIDEALDVEREGFAPCPTCRQYSHSIGEGQLADAFNHFQSMFCHRGEGIPTQHSFDEETRDAAQVLMTAALKSQPATDERKAVERLCASALKLIEECDAVTLDHDRTTIAEAAKFRSAVRKLEKALPAPPERGAPRDGAN